jgi:hypothetical protein
MAILEEGKRNDIKVNLAKYFLETYDYWRKKFNVYGFKGLAQSGC